MTLWINGAFHNAEALAKYCSPHGIDPESVLSIAVNDLHYQIDYMNKDGNYCTMLVHEKAV